MAQPHQAGKALKVPLFRDPSGRLASYAMTMLCTEHCGAQR